MQMYFFSILETVRKSIRSETGLHSRVANRLMSEISGERIAVESSSARDLEVLKLIAPIGF